MKNAATLTLTVASAFLAVVALMVNSPALFYMGLALIVTILAAKFQARYAVRDLQISRMAPSTAQIGEPVTVMLGIRSLRKLTRPLLLVQDQVPKRLKRDWLFHPIPVAPSYQQEVVVKYQFVPKRRGQFAWDEVTIVGSDALGLATSTFTYQADAANLKVFPAPLPFDLDLNLSGGFGSDESTAQRSAANSLDTRGVREYVRGDPRKLIHWRSTAKTGELKVKEFDARTNTQATIFIQKSLGTEVMFQNESSLDLLCGHAAFLISKLLPLTNQIVLGGFRESLGKNLSTYLDALSGIAATDSEPLSETIKSSGAGGEIYIFLSVTDTGLPQAIRALSGANCTVFILPTKQSDSAYQNPGFMDEVQRAGARVRLLPVPEVK